jgi:hypothetical protein
MAATRTKSRDGSRALRALELKLAHKSWRQIAAQMRITQSSARKLVQYAASNRTKFQATREKEIDRGLGMLFGCKRCGLRGRHICVDGAERAGASGPGVTYPAWAP